MSKTNPLKLMHLPVENDIISIQLPFSEALNSEVSFIIDTGSVISLIKIGQIPNKHKIRYNEVKILKGVSGDTIQTVGSIVGTITFNNKKFQHEFYLVPEYLNFGNANAILGLDFLSKNNAVIDIKHKKLVFKKEAEESNNTLTSNNSRVTNERANMVTLGGGSLTKIGKEKNKNKNKNKRAKLANLPVSSKIKLDEKLELKDPKKGGAAVQLVTFDELALVHMEPESSYFKSYKDKLKLGEISIRIPAGREQIIQIELDSNEEQICLAKNMSDKLLIADCIIKPKNGKANLAVANVSDEDIYLREIDLELVPLGEYTILSIRSDATNRISEIYKLSKVNKLNRQEREIIFRVIADYSDVFYIEGDTLSYTPTQVNDIQTLVDKAPVNVRPYKLPMVQRAEINKQVKSMLEENIIEPSNSLWNSPLLCVKKKAQNGKEAWRVVVDFRKLNDITVGFSHPIPDINEILMQLGKCRYFSKIDLKSGFHQILLKPEDRVKTAFTVNNESYHYVRSPFGLKNLSAQFCMLMKNVMSVLHRRYSCDGIHNRRTRTQFANGV